MDAYVSPTTKPLYRATQIVWYIVGVLEVALLFRFLLKLFGANAAAGFTSFIYTVTLPFVAPFRAVFRQTEVAGAVFEWTTLLAMFVYWCIGYGIIKLFIMSRSVSTPEAAQKLSAQER